MRRLRFDPQAVEEMEEAADYYRDIDPRLKERFIESLGLALGLLRQFPKSGIPVSPRLRKSALKGFPFQLIYHDEAESRCIIIFALAHHARKPGYWGRRV
jgi:plasmid stabilization system protein ParE